MEIAKRHNGEIINGDAMQLYEGLPIITNKITQEEMQGVRHHLLGCIGLEEETWAVGRFVKHALGVVSLLHVHQAGVDCIQIDEIRSRGKLPILVGGTHYYTQSLLFKDTLTQEPLLRRESGPTEGRFPILDGPTEVILEKLKEVDPIIAERWHPTERRKIRRSLEIYFETGQPASQIYDAQRLQREMSSASPGEGDNSTSIRFPTLVFWVHASKESLTPRLNGRIDKMIQKGLLSEVQTLTAFATAYEKRTGMRVDPTRGIWVSIGYKEFLDYQAALSNELLSDGDRENLKKAAIEATQAHTRQYAKRQVRWIQIKLLNALIAAGQRSKTFLLDGSDLSRWSDDVVLPSLTITEQFLEGRELPNPNELAHVAQGMLEPRQEYDLAQRPDLWQKRVCEVCRTVAVTENNWLQHLRSKGHKAAIGAKKKREKAPESLQKKEKVGMRDAVDLFEGSLDAFTDETSGDRPTR